MKKFVWIFIVASIVFNGFLGVNAAMFYDGELSAESVYVVNKNTGLPIVEKNALQKLSPASLTKMMTFIVAYQNSENVSNTMVPVKQSVLDFVDPESSGVKLKAGEEISLLNLLHCILICSSGDAAMVIADYIGSGDISNFVAKMNQKASELGCTDTHFANPDGIYNDEQYSTAEDIYKICRCGMDIPLFANIVSKSEYSFFGDERDPIITTNKMIDSKRGGAYYMDCVKGIKTGYVQEVGRCLASCAQKGESYYISVVMGAPHEDASGNALEKNMAMVDTKNIYEWAFNCLKTIKVYPKDFPIREINLGLVWRRDKLMLSPQSDFYAALPAEYDKNDITVKVNAPDSVDAPVIVGDVLGSAEVFYKSEKIGEFNLVSSQSYKKNYFVLLGRICSKIIYSPVFIILFVLVMAFVIFYILCMIRQNKRRRRKNKIKRFPPKNKINRRR